MLTAMLAVENIVDRRGARRLDGQRRGGLPRDRLHPGRAGARRPAVDRGLPHRSRRADPAAPLPGARGGRGLTAASPLTRPAPPGAGPVARPAPLESWPGLVLLVVALLGLAAGLLAGCAAGRCGSTRRCRWRSPGCRSPSCPGRCASDGAPPLYYLLLHGWTAVFGDRHDGGPAAQRGPRCPSRCCWPTVLGRRLGGVVRRTRRGGRAGEPAVDDAVRLRDPDVRAGRRARARRRRWRCWPYGPRRPGRPSASGRWPSRRCC